MAYSYSGCTHICIKRPTVHILCSFWPGLKNKYKSTAMGAALGTLWVFKMQQTHAIRDNILSLASRAKSRQDDHVYASYFLMTADLQCEYSHVHAYNGWEETCLTENKPAVQFVVLQKELDRRYSPIVWFPSPPPPPPFFFEEVICVVLSWFYHSFENLILFHCPCSFSPHAVFHTCTHVSAMHVHYSKHIQHTSTCTCTYALTNHLRVYPE